MRTTFGIFFRASASDIRSRLPASLAFIERTLHDPSWHFDHNEYSTAGFNTDPSLLEEMVTWGQQEHKGKTLISMINITERYELADLQHFDFVEVLFAPKRGGKAKVKKMERSYEIAWQCSFCNRTSWAQKEDLEVKVRPNVDFLLTDTYEWIASKQVLQFLEQTPIAYRPLKNNQDYIQLVLPEPVTIETKWPVAKFDPCPECHRFMGVLRSLGTADGKLDLDNDGLQIRREYPLWIKLPQGGSLQFAQGDERFARFEPPPNLPPHNIGGKVDGHAPLPWSYFFADARLVERLLENGAAGIGFRPVNILS